MGNSPVTGEFPVHKGQWRGDLMFSLICAWLNGWVNNREAGDLSCPLWCHCNGCDDYVSVNFPIFNVMIYFPSMGTDTRQYRLSKCRDKDKTNPISTCWNRDKERPTFKCRDRDKSWSYTGNFSIAREYSHTNLREVQIQGLAKQHWVHGMGNYLRIHGIMG